MIVRIVKLTFKKENIASFERIFEETNQHIRAFEGCQFLELYKDTNHPKIFFTYSHWLDPDALGNYRKSDYFNRIWNRTKPLFDAKPEAWSVNKVRTLT